jgi:hypothetical protein
MTYTYPYEPPDGLTVSELELHMFAKYTEMRDDLKERVLNDNLDFSKFENFRLVQGKTFKGLYQVRGFYFIVNRRTKRFMIGKTKNLSGRRTEYSTRMHANPRPATLYPELEITWPQDFYFFPFIAVRRGFSEEQIKECWTEVEDKLLQAIPETEKNIYYNRAGTVFAEKKDTTPKSVCYQGYYWPSKLAAANYFSTTDTSISNFMKLNVIRQCSSQEIGFNVIEPPKSETDRQKMIKDLKADVKQARAEFNPLPVVLGNKKYPIFIGANLKDLHSNRVYLNEDYIFDTAKRIILEIVQNMDNNTFIFEHYPLKSRAFNYKEKKGFYLLLNKTNKRFYIGESADIPKRRRDHHNVLKKKDKSRLNEKFHAEWDAKFIEKNFYFVPFLIYPEQSLKFIDDKSLKSVLESVERQLRDYFFSLPQYARRLYNMR